MKVWLNGTLVPGELARIDPADRGFTLGDGLFETLVARSGRLRRLDAHLARLRRGAEVIGLTLPDIDFAAALAAVLTANGLTDAVVRLTVTRGPASRGVPPPPTAVPTVLVAAAILPPPAPPARCIVASVTRRNEHSPASGIKSLNYLDNILARREAAARGADEAILLNTAGRVAEATTANLFLVRGGAVLTPPLADGALPGIMRAVVLTACGGREQALMPEDLATADEMFLTSSLGVRAVIAVDDRRIGDGPGPVTLEMSKRVDALES